jgi:hypothetical protein
MLLLTPGYLLVLDDLTADHDARFDWLYHHRGTAVSSPVSEKPGQIDEPLTGKEFLQNVRVGQSKEPIAIDFSGDVPLRLLSSAAPDTGLVIADGPGESVDQRIPLALLTRRGRSARFAVSLEPIAKGAKPNVLGIDAESTRTTVRHTDYVDEVLLTAQSIQVRSRGELKLEARVSGLGGTE